MHAIDVTKLLRSHLTPKLGKHPGHMGIEIKMDPALNKFNFIDDFFDVQVNRPYIMMEYFKLDEQTLDNMLLELNTIRDTKSLRR